MAAAVSGIWNHAAAAQSPMTTGAKPMAAAQNDDSNDNSDSGGATISSNDFLTLLVTEMQNQDPTADTDPNEYINQLVNVNSLEQLIQINQTLSSAAGAASGDAVQNGAGAGVPATSQAASASTAHPQTSPASSSSPSSPTNSSGAAGPTSNSTMKVPSGSASIGSAPAAATYGNLSAPRESRAALRVSRALDGQRITR